MGSAERASGAKGMSMSKETSVTNSMVSERHSRPLDNAGTEVRMRMNKKGAWGWTGPGGLVNSCAG